MPIQYVEGDLFKNRFNAEALAHGCNAVGVMGAGIAVEFKKRYPKMFELYRLSCQAGELEAGKVMFYYEDDKPAVFNLITQPDCNGATYEAIASSLVEMHRRAKFCEIKSIAMPAIGAGLGGLDWREIKHIIEFIFADWEGTLYVYEKYVAGI